METCEVVVWVLVDRDGDYSVGKDQESAASNYEADFTNLNEGMETRYVKVVLTVPKPRPVVLTAVVPDEPSEGVLTVSD